MKCDSFNFLPKSLEVSRIFRSFAVDKLNYRRYNNDVRYECTQSGSCSFLE